MFQRMKFIFLVLSLSSSLSMATDIGNSKQETLSSDYSIPFSSMTLKISGPTLDCPVLKKLPAICPGGTILLDPGHDDQLDSKRNSTKNFNEGRANMAVSLLLRDLISRCGGVATENIRLVRWPGENFYGEYENPESYSIPIHQPSARLDGILSRVQEMNALSAESRPILNISLHANSSGDPAIKPDRVEVYFPVGSSKDWERASGLLKDAIVAETLVAYRGNSPAEEKRIRENVRKKSFARPMDFAVLTELTGPSSIMKLVVEMFYMDSSQKRYLEKESNLTLPETVKLVVERTDSSGKSNVIESYPITRLQRFSAYGLYRGLSEIFPCQ